MDSKNTKETILSLLAVVVSTPVPAPMLGQGPGLVQVLVPRLQLSVLPAQLGAPFAVPAALCFAGQAQVDYLSRIHWTSRPLPI